MKRLLAFHAFRSPVLFLGLVAVGFAFSRAAKSALSGQGAARYTPAYLDIVSLDSVQEMIMIFIGSGSCTACADDDLPNLVDRAKIELATRSHKAQHAFSAIGVGVDSDPRTAFRQLRRFGTFDEIIGGRNWSGLGMLYFAWYYHPGPATVPQIVIIRRTLRASGGRIHSIDGEEVLARIVGLHELQRWAKNGYQIGI